MKVVIVTELFFPSVGGQEVRYRELIPYLVRKGHEITVLAIAHADDLQKEEFFEGARIIRSYRDPKYLGKGTGKGRPFKSIVGFSISLLSYWRILRSADVVLFNKWPILPQLLYGHLVRNGIVDWCEIRQGAIWRIIYYFMARATPRHIGVSDAIVDYLRNEQRIAVEKSHTVPSGISSQMYERSPKVRIAKQILFFGRISEHKDPGLLLRAFLRSFPPESGYRLVMAGDGELLEALRREAADVSNVIFTGKISDTKKIRLLGESVLLVLPSKREGFPRVIAEAAAAGTPTLTVNRPMNGGTNVVTQYKMGWICEPTEAALASEIVRYADITNLEWIDASEKGRRAATQHFDWEVVSEELISFFERKTGG